MTEETKFRAWIRKTLTKMSANIFPLVWIIVVMPHEGETEVSQIAQQFNSRWDVESNAGGGCCNAQIYSLSFVFDFTRIEILKGKYECLKS